MKANFPIALFILIGFISSCTSKQETEPDNSPLLGAGFGIESATFIVQNLDSSRNYYTKVLGFKMPEKFNKGRCDGTLSASVSFPDWSAIELISVNTGLVATKHLLLRLF